MLVDVGIDDFAGALESRQRRGSGAADVEARTGRRPVPAAPPRDVAPELVGGVEVAGVEDRLGEAHRHRRVVGPRSRREPERPATDHVVDRRERARPAELEGGADGIADGQPDECADRPITCADPHDSVQSPKSRQ